MEKGTQNHFQNKLQSTMYSPFFKQDLRPRKHLGQDIIWSHPTPPPAIEGLAMSRNYSNQSSISTQSRSSEDFYLPISSSSSMSFDWNVSDSSQHHDDGYNQGYNNYTTASHSLERSLSSHSNFMKATPSSLGWAPESELLRLYKFIVPKGKEPHLELRQGYQICFNVPQRVYLDPPSNPQRGIYPCQFPTGCPGKQFRRPADLERHYRHVHADADQKGSFPCDYKPCTRSKGPFTRKDHYRDHLKDFHKEDIGTAKQPKHAKDLKTIQALRQAWLQERQIDPRWWRCRRCLQRVYVDTHGYKCITCNEECTEERIKAREQKKHEMEKEKTQYPEQDLSMTHGGQCTSCNGSMWITDSVFAEGNSVPCPICLPSGEIVYEEAEWDGDDINRFDTSYAAAY
ncbi:dedf643d-e780-4689-a075-725ca4ab91fb [Sclerotinia trifoliorum]|uniref:Dedf643d-e780-4689-a075-725ca4ab91fb n=1 Tax=Sclerotinia trifoliorum TaxID=28548 RepID=A0A8H2ZS98_9HELO|nr:dedf643d-e780-4689-a075-725ca4ab91fb [Sclerotinia trifoliorum]